MCTWNEVEEQIDSREDGQENADNVALWSAFGSTPEKSFASTNDFPYYHTWNI
jgi:hypothetical protein